MPNDKRAIGWNPCHDRNRFKNPLKFFFYENYQNYSWNTGIITSFSNTTWVINPTKTWAEKKFAHWEPEQCIQNGSRFV